MVGEVIKKPQPRRISFVFATTGGACMCVRVSAIGAGFGTRKAKVFISDVCVGDCMVCTCRIKGNVDV